MGNETVSMCARTRTHTHTHTHTEPRGKVLLSFTWKDLWAWETRLDEIENNTSCRGCGEIGTLGRCWWECQMVPLRQKTVWGCLRKLKAEKQMEHDHCSLCLFDQCHRTCSGRSALNVSAVHPLAPVRSGRHFYQCPLRSLLVSPPSHFLLQAPLIPQLHAPTPTFALGCEPFPLQARALIHGAGVRGGGRCRERRPSAEQKGLLFLVAWDLSLLWHSCTKSAASRPLPSDQL